MFISNASISHNLKNWLMCLIIEIEKTKRGLSLKKRCWFNSNWTSFGYWIITGAIEQGFMFGLYGWKTKP